MTLRRMLILGLVVPIGSFLAFGYSQVDGARKSIEFDLKTIGMSIYQAHDDRGQWPKRVEDLEGTAYLNMPYRKAMLDDAWFVVLWHQDLDSNPESNRDRVLAFDNHSLLARSGRVLVCRGDLRVESIKARELQSLVNASQCESASSTAPIQR